MRPEKSNLKSNIGNLEIGNLEIGNREGKSGREIGKGITYKN
jgi:hypothetical protein